MNIPALPPGAAPLGPDELERALARGNHPEVRAAGMVDAQLVEAVRAGWLSACRLDDGRLAFARTELADRLLAELEDKR